MKITGIKGKAGQKKIKKGQKKKKTEKKSLKITGPMMVVLSGIAIIAIVYGLTSGMCLNALGKAGENTISFVKNRTIEYENSRNNDKVNSLYNLADKAEELARSLCDTTEDFDRFINEYKYDQRIDDVILLDENLKCEYETGESYSKWKSFVENQIVRNITIHPQKIYCTRIDSDNYSIDVAAVGRRDKPGLVFVTAEIQKNDISDGEVTIKSLIKDFTFDLDGIVIITDGMKVVSSNESDLVGKTREECLNLCDGKINTEGHGLLNFKARGKNWYGWSDKSEYYHIFVLFPKTAVFAARDKVVTICIILYIISLSAAIIGKQHMEFKESRQMKKQYRIIASISSMYSAAILYNLEEDRCEIVKNSSVFYKVFDEKLNIKTMIDRFTEINVMANQREEYMEFMNFENIGERLKKDSYISFETQGPANQWYMTAVMAQDYDENEKIKSVLILYRDISMEKQKEAEYQKQLLEAAREAKQANIAKTDFLRRMSHDIRTPINGIRGMVDICRYNMGNEEKEKSCLDKIMSASGFLLDLVNDVLDMNKLESDNIVINVEPFTLSGVLSEVNSVIEVQAMESGIKYTYPKEMLPYDNLVGSSLYLRQILQNILSNAIKYNVEGGLVELEIFEKVSDGQKVDLKFVCKDTGIGMSEEFQKQIYEPFAQENSSARTAYKGTGLGLPITKKLVEHMGGTIDFISKKGCGTVFNIVIPFDIDKDSKVERIESYKQDNLMRGMNVLLVEDNDINIEIAEFILVNLGAKVTKASNGKEAVEIYKKSKTGWFDIIFMDVMMPVMGGLEATKKIRNLRRADSGSVIIIAMSANAFHDDIERSLDAGMNGHLSKPIDGEKIIETVAKCMAGN